MGRPFLAFAAAALMLPAMAAAKGPSQATITGPGLKRAIVIPGASSATSLGLLATRTGVLSGMFGLQPDSMLRDRPKGALGPEYTITWFVPGPHNQTDRLKQELYPYAAGGALTYMRPGQPFFGADKTDGGWYRGGAELKQTLNVFLPKNAPNVSPKPTDAPSGRNWTAAAFLAAVLAVLAAAMVLGRRTHPAPTA